MKKLRLILDFPTVEALAAFREEHLPPDISIYLADSEDFPGPFVPHGSWYVVRMGAGDAKRELLIPKGKT